MTNSVNVTRLLIHLESNQTILPDLLEVAREYGTMSYVTWVKFKCS